MLKIIRLLLIFSLIISSKLALATQTMDKYIGKSFIFLPKSKKQIEDKSNLLISDPWFNAFNAGCYDSDIKKNECKNKIIENYTAAAGKPFILLEIKKEKDTIETKKFYIIKFIENGSIHKILAEDDDCIKGTALLSEIEGTKKWKGKTFWAKNTIFLKNLNSETGEEELGDYIEKFSPFIVKDIDLGYENYAPIRLFVQSSTGKKGFIDVAFSEENIKGIDCLKNYYARYDKIFFTQNPEIIYKNMNKQVYNAIKNGRLLIGMTEDQVGLSIGYPETTNTDEGTWGTNEQWVYGVHNYYKYVYLKNGKVTSWQR